MLVTLSRVGLVLLNVFVFLFEEGWIIAMVAIFPFWLAVLLVTLLLSTFAAISTYLCGRGELPLILERWIEKQKTRASKRLAKVAEGAFWLSILSTAIIVSPTTSAVMLYLMGVRNLKAYITDVFLSIISGTIWCLIYGGIVIIIRKTI